MAKAPESIKDVVVKLSEKAYKNSKVTNMIPPVTRFLRNGGVTRKLEKSIGKYADVENFGERAKNLTDRIFKEFNFKK